MSFKIKRLLVISIFVCILLTLLAPGCGQPPPETATQPLETTPELTSNTSAVEVVTSPPSSEMKVTLSLDGAPWLGQPVQVIATFALAEPFKTAAGNTTARIVVPEGFELVSGKLDWQGDVLPGTTYEIRATIRAVKYGDWRIETKAMYSPSKSAYRVGTAYLYALVYEDRATVSDRPSPPTGPVYLEPAKPPTETPPEPKPGEGDISPGILIPTENSSGGYNLIPKSLSPPDPSFPLGGMTFENPLVITGGFYAYISENSLPASGTARADILQPLVWGGVEIHNARTGQLLGADITDEGYPNPIGTFSITVENPYPDAFYAVIWPASGAAMVVDPSKTLYSAAYYYKGFTSSYYPGQSQQSYDIG